MQCYHLRITAKWADIEKGLIRDFLTKFEPDTYIFSEEVSQQDVIHIHGHLEYTIVPSKSTLSDLFKRYKLSGLYYHKQLVKDRQNNLLYVCKDLNIKSHNLEQYYLDEIISKTVEINEDKKKDTRHKLYELYHDWFKKNRPKCDYEVSSINDFGDEIIIVEAEVTEYGTFITELETIALFINDLYVNIWDKEPPLAHISGYVLYIATKMNKLYKHYESTSQEYYSLRSFYYKRFS